MAVETTQLASYPHRPWLAAQALVDRAMGNTPSGCLRSLGWALSWLALVALAAAWLTLQAFGVGLGELDAAVLDRMVVDALAAPPASAYLAFVPAGLLGVWRIFRALKAPRVRDVVAQLSCPDCGGPTTTAFDDAENFLVVCKGCRVVFHTGISNLSTGGDGDPGGHDHHHHHF